MNSIIIRPFVVFFIIIGSQSYALPFPVSFPGTSEAPDPTGRYSILWFESSPHEAFFKNLKSGQISSLLGFNRGIDILWSPDGNALAITDHSGSSESSVLITRTDGPIHLFNLEDVFIRFFGMPYEIYENGHRYFEASEWVNSSTLLFKVKAHDAYPGKSYEGVFRYELGGEIKKEINLQK